MRVSGKATSRVAVTAPVVRMQLILLLCLGGVVQKHSLVPPRCSVAMEMGILIKAEPDGDSELLGAPPRQTTP